MRGAFYVATALFVVTSSQTAAETDQPKLLHIYDHDGMVAGDGVGQTLHKRFRQGSHDGPDKLAPTAADEERMNGSSATKNLLPKLEEAVLSMAGKGTLSDSEMAYLALENTLAKELDSKLRLKPPADLAFVASRGSVSHKRIKLSRTEWRNRFNVQAKKLSHPGSGLSDSLIKQKPIVKGPTDSQIAPDKMEVSPDVKTIRDEFSKLESLDATEEEVAMLQSIINSYDSEKEDTREVSGKICEQAATFVIGKSLEIHGIQSPWWRALGPKMFNVLNDALNVQYFRLMRKYEYLNREKPIIDATDLETKNLLIGFSERVQPGHHNRIG